VLPLSAASPEALRAQAGRFRERLARDTSGDAWADLCYTAAVRRTHHEHRLALVARAPEEAVDLLGSFARGEPSPRCATGRAARQGRPTLVFVFPGQGPQWWAMGRELLERDATFQEALDECDRALRPHAGWSVREALFAEERASRLHETQFAQPALVALQIALARRWRGWGIVPDAVVGHSLGEVAAAHVGGVLSLEDAMRIAYHRGRVMQKATGRGRMGAAELPVAEVEAAIAGHGGALSIAAVNGPRQTVMSGETAALEDVLRALRARSVRCHELPVDYAFHSAQMASLTPELARALRGLQPRPASVPVVPSAEGANGDGFDVSYWAS
jgi:acyl transferase domain-containing protein